MSTLTRAHAPDRAEGFFSAFRARVLGWREEARKRAAWRDTRDQLAALSDRELDDLGLTRLDIDRAARTAVYGPRG